MSFASEFGRSFSGTMAAKAKEGGSDKDESAKKPGLLVKKVSGLFKKTPTEPAEQRLPERAGVMGTYKKGGKIPKTGNYKLHKGETVVPAGLARGLERLGKKGPQKIKPKKVSLGKKGGFTIKHPGVFKAAAKRAGMSTQAFAQKKKSAPGTLGRRARSALGLMAMGK